MQINTTTGLVHGVRFVPSPNCDDRPEGALLRLLVIHNISLPPGVFGHDHVECLFTNCLDGSWHPEYPPIAHLKVSAHCFIRRDGEIIQFVPFHKNAWHAGVSCYQDTQNCNGFSIGIELEGTDTHPYETIQYQKLAQLTQALLTAYPTLSHDHIVGHSDIAPGRKTDPGPSFDWRYFREQLKKGG